MGMGLVISKTIVEAHHDDMRQHYPTARRGDARQVNAHLSVVREADDQLVNDAILPHSARNGLDLNILRPMANKVSVIKALDLCPAGSAR